MSILHFPGVPPHVFDGVIAQLRTNSKVTQKRNVYAVEGRGIAATVEYVAMLQAVTVTLHRNPFGDEIVRAEIQASIDKATYGH